MSLPKRLRQKVKMHKEHQPGLPLGVKRQQSTSKANKKRIEAIRKHRHNKIGADDQEVVIHLSIDLILESWRTLKRAR